MDLHQKMEIPDIPKYPLAYPGVNPVDIYRCFITKALEETTGLASEVIYPALQWQNNLTYGDLVLAIPRLRVSGVPPAQLAREWAAKLPSISLTLPPEPDNIYLRFRFSPQSLPSVLLPMIYRLGRNYGLNRSLGLRDRTEKNLGLKKLIVEFSSPNIAKEFHAGHLRSTIIGGFLSNLYEGTGWDVVRVNYLGDWGRQFGLLAVGWKKFGSEEQFKNNPLGHLFDIYVKISALFKAEEEIYKGASKRGEDTSILESQGILGEAKSYFKKMEDNDEEALSLWRRFRDLSIEKYKATYARLNIFFSEYSGESQVRKESMEKAETILRNKGITEFDNGATIINFEKHGTKKLGVAVIRNRNGTSNYLLRDIGAAMERWDRYRFDKMIYVVMFEQEAHLSRLFKIMDLLGGEYAEAAKRMQHITFGKVAGMSTRKGNVKLLDDILEECGTCMHEVMMKNKAKYEQVEHPEKVADTLGISAVMVQDMSGKRINNYHFDIARMISFEGDTGPYLQYAHARLCSISRKTGLSREQLETANFSLLTEPHATDLLRLMAQYPDTIAQTLQTLEPTTILTYLFRLTHQLSSSYDVLRVISAPEGPEVSTARAALYDAARQVIANGMRLLGLGPVERM